MNSSVPLIDGQEWRRDPLRARHVAEFFAGIGLMRLGLEPHGWSIAYANDIAEDKRAMYAAQFEDADAHFQLADIHEIEAAEVPSVTLATASFPCTDLSLAGMRQGLGGKQSSAFWGFVRVLEEMKARRPPLILIENVTGFLSSHGGRDFQAALLALNELGYAVDPFIIDAAHFVPQSRLRLFVLGHQRDRRAGSATDSPPLTGVNELRPKGLMDFIIGHPEIDWDLRPLPPLPALEMDLSDILEDLPDDSPFWWPPKRRDYLLGQMSDRHAGMLRRMMSADEWSYGTAFRRVRRGRSMAELRVDGIAGCLRTPKGGSARQIVVKAGFGRALVRPMTPREYARLMGADDFVIDVSMNKAFFGFGDAVCVPVIAWIAKEYLNPLAEEMQQRWDLRRDRTIYRSEHLGKKPVSNLFKSNHYPRINRML